MLQNEQSVCLKRFRLIVISDCPPDHFIEILQEYVTGALAGNIGNYPVTIFRVPSFSLGFIWMHFKVFYDFCGLFGYFPILDGSPVTEYQMFRHCNISFLRWFAVCLAIISLRRGKALRKEGQR